jgi:AAA15 family ATPase/GTPase
MINRIKLNNFGPMDQLDWQKLGKINLIIGNNSSGKTFLLKAMYSAMRTLEEYKRGDDQRKASEILAEKLYWTFQPEKIGDLVSKQADSPLFLELTLDDKTFDYSFGKDTIKSISSVENHIGSRTSNSIFLPAKEVLSLHNIILKSREQDKVFGFDDTYLDLARALRLPTTRGNNYPEFAQSRQQLDDMFGGKVDYDESSGRWQFKKGKQKFPIGVTAEGIKKIALLDTLLGNRYLDKNSVVFIDELESALHPTAISKFIDILAILASCGIQFFIASHSYFVIKKLFLIAQEQKLSIPTLSKDSDTWQQSNLLDEMPDNAIIEESIRLYKEEVGLAFK